VLAVGSFRLVYFLANERSRERNGGGGASEEAPVRYPPRMADKTSGMKSAYELALERLEKQGIERPRTEGLGEEVQQKIAEARKQAEAKIAELEILHRDRLGKINDPSKRQEEQDDYVRERRRIEDDRDRKIEKLRAG
jgi:hypothetical protein